MKRLIQLWNAFVCRRKGHIDQLSREEKVEMVIRDGSKERLIEHRGLFVHVLIFKCNRCHRTRTYDSHLSGAKSPYPIYRASGGLALEYKNA